MSINDIEASGASLEAASSATVAFWAIPNTPVSQQQSLFNKIIAETDAAEKQQQQWEKMRLEHQRKIDQARSSVASIGDKLGETAKYLVELGKEPNIRGQVVFYYGFFSDVNASLEKLEEQTRNKQEAAGEKVRSMEKLSKSEAVDAKLADEQNAANSQKTVK